MTTIVDPEAEGIVDRDNGRLVWGLALLISGVFWLLATLGVARTPRLAWMFGSAVLLTLSGLLYIGYRSQPARRFGLLIPAGILAALGLMLLGEGLRILPDALLPLLLFAGPALAFLRIHTLDPRRGWALLMAWILAVLGLTSFLGSMGWLGGSLAGTVFLWGSAAPFLWHFLHNGRDWAILPAGFLLTFGAIPPLDRVAIVEELAGAIVCFGMSASFAALYLLARPAGTATWARYPAVALALVGAVTALAVVAGPLVRFGIPLALIAFGAYLIWNARGPAAARDPGSGPTPRE